MTSAVRLGVLTPSSNTALEPLTSAIVAGLPGSSAHFSRFRVTEISLQPQALGQFDDSKILAAAELLADARVDVIGWSGTAAGWLGFDADLRLVERIRERTGLRATTAVLALNELLALQGIDRLALVTPYTGDVQHHDDDVEDDRGHHRRRPGRFPAPAGFGPGRRRVPGRHPEAPEDRSGRRPPGRRCRPPGRG